MRAAAKTQQTLREPRRRTHARKQTHKQTHTPRAHSAALAASAKRRALPAHAEARRRHEVDVCPAHKTHESPAESRAAVKSPAASCHRANRAKWCGAPKKCSGPGTAWQQGRPVPVQMWQRGRPVPVQMWQQRRPVPVQMWQRADRAHRSLRSGRRPRHVSARQAKPPVSATGDTTCDGKQPTRKKEIMSEQANKQTNERAERAKLAKRAARTGQPSAVTRPQGEARLATCGRAGGPHRRHADAAGNAASRALTRRA